MKLTITTKEDGSFDIKRGLDEECMLQLSISWRAFIKIMRKGSISQDVREFTNAQWEQFNKSVSEKKLNNNE